MVGHYTRADIPAFGGDHQWWTRLNNVRNSLVTPAVPLRLRINFAADDDEARQVELKIYIADTKLLAPTGRQSLAELGKLVGFEKLKLADNPADELLYKKNMKALRDHDWPTFREYALRDAEVSARYFEQIANQYRQITGSKFVPSVLSSIGVTLQVKDWKARGLDPLEMVGREKHEEPYWNERKGFIQKSCETPYQEELSWHVGFITECYHGGRNEQLWFGPSFEDAWTDYDLTSAYPTAMANIGMPRWREIREMTAADLTTLTSDTLAFANVEFNFPDSIRYPTMPVRTANGIIFPKRGRSYCAAPEILLARKLGCQIKLRRGVIIPHDPNNLVFFDFIKFAIAQRNAAKSEIEKQFWKEVVNSCYGKTAKGLREKRVFSLRAKRTKKLPESAITNPAYAAFITSFVRAVCGEIMNALPNDRMAFSVTTDGFITNASAEEMATATSGELAQRYRATTQRLSGDELLKVKHEARQLLGIKTRGQATIWPGQRKDPKENIVLARASMRPPIWATETTEHNDWLVKTFIDRTGSTLIEMDVLTSMREMILYDADLVAKSVRKNLPTEFDFKRRPHAVGMVSGKLPDGTDFSHLAFSTEPFEDVAEFKLVRDMFDDYRRPSRGKAQNGSMRGPQFCLKTVDDFRQFADFVDRQRSLSNDKKRYLHKADHDGLQRFRRDLCDALKNGKAGFEYYTDVTNNEFAKILNEAGFKDSPAFVEVEHVENGKRRDFEPNATVPTRQVLAVMKKLKQRFPELREDEFLGALPEGAAKWLAIADRPLL